MEFDIYSVIKAKVVLSMSTAMCAAQAVQENEYQTTENRAAIVE